MKYLPLLFIASVSSILMGCYYLMRHPKIPDGALVSENVNIYITCCFAPTDYFEIYDDDSLIFKGNVITDKMSATSAGIHYNTNKDSSMYKVIFNKQTLYFSYAHKLHRSSILEISDYNQTGVVSMHEDPGVKIKPIKKNR